MTENTMKDQAETKAQDADNTKKHEGYIYLDHTFNDRFSGGEVTVGHYFKKPTRQQISRAQKGLHKDSMKSYGTFLTEIVHPDEKDALAENTKKYPGISATFGNAVMSAVGVADLGN